MKYFSAVGVDEYEVINQKQNKKIKKQNKNHNNNTKRTSWTMQLMRQNAFITSHKNFTIVRQQANKTPY